jgi:acetoacetyl-CoA synthetase
MNATDLEPRSSRRVGPERQHDLEETIGRLWESILERGPARLDAQILEMRLGVRRIHRFLMEIGRLTGVELPISVVFDAPTLADLIAVVRGGTTPPFSPLAILRRGEPGPALFLAPGLGGVALELCDLARRLEFPGTIYATQPVGLDGCTKPFDTAQEQAQFEVKAVRQVQPHGPYFLGGFSWGGVIALEMARQLSAAGERVPFVGLIEAQLPEKFWPVDARLEFVMRRARHHTAALRRLNSREKLGYLVDRARPIAGRIRSFLGRPVEWSPYRVENLPDELYQVREASIAAYSRYIPQPFDGPVTYFKSKNGDPLSCDQLKVWPRFLPCLEISHLPGDHASMLREPVVSLLAEEVSRLLRRENHAIA